MTTNGGFWGGQYLGWVGQRPKSEADLQRIEAENLEYARAQAARRAEELRPAEERVARVKAELLAQLPPDLARAVKETAAEAQRLGARVREAQRALEAHLATEPDEDTLEDWLNVKLRLEGQLPHLRRFHERANQAANAALEAARASIKGPCRQRSEAAAETLRAFTESQRAALQAAQMTQRLEAEGVSRAMGFTLADLAELADSGNPANDNHKTRKGK